MTRLLISLILAVLVFSACQLQQQAAVPNSTLFERKKECAQICTDLYKSEYRTSANAAKLLHTYNPALDTCIYRALHFSSDVDGQVWIHREVVDCLSHETILRATTVNAKPFAESITVEEFNRRADLLMEGLNPSSDNSL